MASLRHNPSSISNSQETTAAMLTDSTSLIKDHVNFHLQPSLSERIMPTKVPGLQPAHPTTGLIIRTSSTQDTSTRHQYRTWANSKIQSRTSDWDLDHTRPAESSSAEPTTCDAQTPVENIPIKIRNGTARSLEKSSEAREELRRFMVSSASESCLLERIRSLERENATMLLEIWRSQLEFMQVKRELRRELFTLKMERIMKKGSL